MALPRCISIDVVCSLEALAIGTIVFLIWTVLEPNVEDSGRTLVARLTQLPTWRAGLWIGFRVLGPDVVVLVIEELAFRGYLLRRMVAWDFENVSRGHLTWLSFAGSSVLFGLLHDCWLAGRLAGACFAIALYCRGRRSNAIAAHMTANAPIAAQVLLGGNSRLCS